MDDCDDTAEVMSMRWFVGDAARMYPPAGPGNLARAVLVAFGAAGDATLRLISDAILDRPGQGPQVGAAWVSQAIAAAAEVLAWERPLDEILQEAQDHWTLQKPPPAGRWRPKAKGLDDHKARYRAATSDPRPE